MRYKKIGKWWRHRTKLGEGFRMICVTCRHFLYLMRYDKSATCGRSMRKVMTSSDSAHQGLSNGMIHVLSFFNIWWDTKNRRHPEVRCGKWWRHQTHLSEGSRMICVTCRHFEYLIRYEKSATSGGSMWKVMTSSNSSLQGFRMICVTCRHFEYLMRYKKSATSGVSMWKVMTSSDSSLRGLSNDIRHVPPVWIFDQIREIGDIRRFDSESNDVIGLNSGRAFEWYASRAAILNI